MSVKEIFENMSYGPAPESHKESDAFLQKHNRKFQLFINGEWTPPQSSEYFPTISPANLETLAMVAEGGDEDVDRAVKAARKAQKKWWSIGGHARARYLYALARQIQKHSRLIAVLESMENGKPVRETRDIDIPLAARHFYHHAGWAQLMETEMPDYEPLGVAGQIIPWNFPFLMLAWKIAPAIAMGNTVVLKPAEFTSLTALLFAEICQNAGLPEGVVNIVTGHGSTGASLVQHPDVDKIAFTGSTEVGKIIRQATAGTGKKLSLELGGKSPFIVFEDADLDSVVEGIVDAIWFNQGQVCCAGSRLLVQESIAEKLYNKIRQRMDKIRVGPSLDKCIDVGAIISPSQLSIIEEYVRKGKDEGYDIWQSQWTVSGDGCFYPPTFIPDVAPSSVLAQEEIFGPVLVAMTFRSHTEAVKLANNTRYGLSASIWTDDINLALDVAPQIKAGTVWINCSNIFDAASGFGGYRESGFGREGGKEGLYEYVRHRQESLLSHHPVTFKQVSKTQKNMSISAIDRTPKNYIGGKQVRPDGGNSITIKNPLGHVMGEVPLSNRKDIRNAVEAAHASQTWSKMTGHARAQVLYFIAENLSVRAEEISQRLMSVSAISQKDANREVEKSIERLFYYAGMADKYDGFVHHTIAGNVTLAMPESIGVLGVVCPEEMPLLGLISAIIPAVTMGNRVVVVPSLTGALLATDFYQILETSDVPGGTINMVTGYRDELAEELAKHYDVDGLWYFGDLNGSQKIETLSTGNLKRTWVSGGKYRDWLEDAQSQGREFLRRASEIKNIWIPYGV